ncbi:hypothetical protein EOM39_05240 [Candidatus Gracilibacteria bacterium]|nr:hypothetical protein [Candidatus Gracilibacteria bacterium]
MTTDGGGWTLVHKTTDNQTDLAGRLDTTEGFSDWNDNSEYRLSINYWKYLSTEKAMARNIRIDGVYWDDIESGYINSISTSAVSFSQTDTYKIFGTMATQNTCTSGTYYWNGSCCGRCVNFDSSATYGLPNNAPMLVATSTSYTGSALEGAGGTNDAGRHKLSKMGIFLR